MTKTEEKKIEKSERNAFNMFKRIIRLDQLLASGVYPNLDYLLKDEEMGGASKATIYRTIKDMKLELNAPIILDKERGGYAYSTKTFRLPFYLLTEKQMESIQVVEKYVEQLKGNPMYENFQSVLNLIKKTTLKNPLDRPYDPYGDFVDYDSSEAVKLDWNVNQHYIILGDSRGGVEEQTWNQIEKAIKERRCINFDYDWPVSKYSHRHGVGKIAPYQVVCSGNKWYLWGWNYEKDAFQLFMMDRVIGVEVLFDRFKLPEKFDYRECGSGVRHIDLMGRKLMKKTFEIETGKTAEELNRECRTTMIKFSENADGKIIAEIACPESSFEIIMEELKKLVNCLSLGEK